jgi:oxepin-CoA hydrolase/3-oxo-5,6-dehydrosuberyl-CoA semialdehyde dehydrogenase
MFEQFLKQLEKLKMDDRPIWGKMTAQHMIEHLILAMKMSTGKINLECYSPPEKIPALKRFLMSSRSLPKLFENPAIGKRLLDLEYESLDEAKVKLKEEINSYNSYFMNYPDAKTINATFGSLNKKEWDIFHRKHFEHHLSQFGLIESK